MALWQGRSNRKPTGGRLRPLRKKRRTEIGSEQQYAAIGDHTTRVQRTAGGNRKVRVLSVQWANVLDPKTKTMRKAKVLSVKENPANPHFVTLNVVTKGATVQTELGLARVTSRPGQDGVVNAVLLGGA